ncbi:MAG: hypothetical protein ACRCZI_03190, partial [Cetobacterium sp.]
EKVCGGSVSLPEGYSISGVGLNQVVLYPDGSAKNTEDFCADLPSEARICTYTGLNLVAVGLSDILEEFGFPPLPSVDANVCDWQKQVAIEEVLRFLEVYSEGSVLGVIQEYVDLPSELKKSVVMGIDVNIPDPSRDIAQAAMAAIKFGQKDLSASVMSAVKAVPLIGDIAVDVLGAVGLSWVPDLLNAIDPDRRDRIVGGTIKAIKSIPLTPHPATWLTNLVAIGMLFGHKEWDEAIGQLFSFLKFLKFTGKAADVLKKIFEVISALLKVPGKIT